MCSKAAVVGLLTILLKQVTSVAWAAASCSQSSAGAQRNLFVVFHTTATQHRHNKQSAESADTI